MGKMVNVQQSVSGTFVMSISNSIIKYVLLSNVVLAFLCDYIFMLSFISFIFTVYVL